MLQFFRNFFRTKIGLAFALVFLGLIALAFASADVSSSGSFGGVAGGDRVAIVGDEKIGTNDLARGASNGLDRVRQERPTITMQTFIAENGLDQVLDALIDRFAIKGFADKYGIRAGANLVNSEIRTIPAFRGPDGNFSEDAYRQALAQQRITDAQARDDLGTSLLSQQLFVPASYGAKVPDKLAYRYAQLFKERRQGTIALLPAIAFAPKGPASESTLKAFYDSNRALFVRPERRVIRFATFDAAALGDSINPTDAEIANRFERDKDQYGASETRNFTQLIVPTEAAANSIRERVEAGASFDAVAREAGLRAAPLNDVEREALGGQASEAVANAYFSAARGTITRPARSPLGWHVARVDTVDAVAARSLAQVRSEIEDTLRNEKRATGLAEFAIDIEDQIADGATLTEIAQERGITLTTTQPALADGRIYRVPNATLPEVLAPALTTAFQMDEEEPEITPLPGGQTYLVYEVSDITQAATAPYAEVKEVVEQSWRQAEGQKAAKAAADRILAKVRSGSTLAAAMSSEKVQLPPVDSVDLSREQLAAQRERRIPPPLALLFSMAEGTTKKLEGRNKSGYYVVDLVKVTMEELNDNDPLIDQARSQMGPLLGDEYADQMRVAMREELGVERNQTAITAVRKQLLGEN
ncbi:MAG: SurA N-terminal domain-containing protein [Erythrobacter sp.]